jgi:hypothetical protein
MKKKKKLLPMIDYKYSTIDSGATPIGSAGRAPDEVGNIGFTIRVKYRLNVKTPDDKFNNSLPSGGICD